MPTLFLINKITCNNNERNLQTQEQKNNKEKNPKRWHLSIISDF